MFVEWVLLCSSALPHADGTVSMLGAGLVQVQPGRFPATVEFAVVTRLRVDPHELPATFKHRVQFRGPEGEPIGTLEGVYDLGATENLSSPVWINVVQQMVGVINHAGTTNVAVSIDDGDSSVCSLLVHGPS